MGHCLNLFHTHNERGCLEKIDGSNCEICGDEICDTPADPKLYGPQFLTDNNCNYIGTVTQDGVPYNPDTHNYMSYSRESCRNRFTPNQAERMYYSLLSLSALIPVNSLPQIQGPKLVCNGASYNQSNSPNSSIVSWSVTPSNLVTPSNGVGSTASFTRVINGNGTIAFSNGCYTLPPFSFHTGPYSSSDYPVSGPSSVCKNGAYAYFNTASLNGATNYQWIYPSSWTYVSGQGTNYLALRTNCSSTSGVVGVRVDNTCGPGGSVNTKYVNVTSCGSCYSYSYSPNPVASTLKIQLEPDFVSAEKAVTDYEVSLISSKQKAVFSTCTNNKSIEIQTEDFPNGLYYLIVNFGDRIEKSQILINH